MNPAPSGGRWIIGGVNNYLFSVYEESKKINTDTADRKKQCDRFYKFHMENVFHCCIITIHIYILYMRFCS